MDVVSISWDLYEDQMGKFSNILVEGKCYSEQNTGFLFFFPGIKILGVASESLFNKWWDLRTDVCWTWDACGIILLCLP